MEKKESQEIQRFGHKHSLTLDEDNKVGGVHCHGCLDPISSGPVYTCIQCRFFLHKFCAELPKEITHPSHIDHQLSLLPRAGLSNYYKCEICRKVRPTEFSYHCERCKFLIDIKCASIMIKTQQTMEMEHGSHKHKLIPIEKSVNLSCDVCARKHEGSFYLCTECGFLVNQECAFLPTTIRLSDDNYHHNHDFTLIHSIPYEDHKLSPYCQICSEIVFRNQWAYFCSICRYFVHIKCSPASSAFKKESREILHLSHYHPLILDEKNEAGGVRCEGCLQPISSSSSVYTCIRCQFFLHKFCAKLLEKMTHPSHIEHQLSLLPRHGLYRNDYKCDICKHERPTEFSYYCSRCNFSVDIKCASMMTKIQQTMQIEHGSHKHKLIPLEKSSYFLCDVCATKHEGSSYVCTECGFWVNQECAFLPSTIRLSDDDYHHDHDLTLIHSIPYFKSESSCKICSGRIFRNQWVYSCSDCRYFFVHIKCSPASKTQHSRDEKVEIENKRTHSKLALYPWAKEHPEEFGNLVAQLIKNVVGSQEKKATDGDELWNISYIHDHEPLIFFEGNKQTKIGQCNVCRQTISISFYRCEKPGCNFIVHERCAKLPNELRNISHIHDHEPLIFFKGNLQTEIRQCNVCRQTISTSFYKCTESECNFYVHEQCAKLPNELRNIRYIHGHEPLIFSPGNLQTNIIKLCTVCKQTISTSFYKCTESECNFYVHQWCAELPKELDYSCHPEHLLQLMTQEFLEFDPPRCECCDIFSNAFYFGCKLCRFYLDVKCAGIPSGIYHESHDHPLTLRPFYSCSICRSLSGYYAFVCEACSHTVCTRCAFLPGKVSHRYDKHPFTLTYSSPFSVKDNDRVKDEFKKTEYYYCEICEEDINPEHWFYHCVECDQSLHIKCICPKIDFMYSKIDL